MKTITTRSGRKGQATEYTERIIKENGKIICKLSAQKAGESWIIYLVDPKLKTADILKVSDSKHNAEVELDAYADIHAN
jgi:hypothetical protein